MHDSRTPDPELPADVEPDELDPFESPRRRSPAWRILLGMVAAVALLAVGAGGTVLALRQGLQIPGVAPPSVAVPSPAGPSPRPPGAPSAREAPPAPEATPLSTPAAAPATSGTEPGEVEVVLTSEALGRIGLKTARVDAVEARALVQVPGTVQPHGYREVKVSPISGGIVTGVHAELGATVRRGAPLATLFSTDLADAQTKYLSMTVMVDADRRKLERTRKLAEIGAASRQELEEVTAAHASRATELEAARQRLLLLGLSREHVAALVSPSQVVSEIVVPAPIDGVVTGRTVNPGQVVGMARSSSSSPTSRKSGWWGTSTSRTSPRSVSAPRPW